MRLCEGQGSGQDFLITCAGGTLNGTLVGGGGNETQYIGKETGNGITIKFYFVSSTR